MFQSLLKKKIVITVLVLVLGSVVYYFFFAGNATSQQTVNFKVKKQRDEVLSALSSYNSFNFSSKFIDSDEFKSLEDMTSPIPSQRPGRLDPFSPSGM